MKISGLVLYLLFALFSCQGKEANWQSIFFLIYWIALGFLTVLLYLKISRKGFQIFLILLILNTLAYWVYSFFSQLNSEIILLPILVFTPAFGFARLLRKDSKKRHEEYQRIFRENKSIRMDMKLAKNIQESLFPKSEEIRGMKYDIYRQIQNQIGGDFFDFVKLREGNVGIFLTDVAGHGVSSAMVAAMLKVMVSTIPYTLKLDPSGLLTYLDSKMANDYKSEHATAIYLYIDFQKRNISLANAGHPYVIYQKKDGEFFEIETQGSLLGYNIQNPIAETLNMSYSPGDRFFLYTDGLIEDTSPKGEFMGPEGLLKILNQMNDEPTETFKNRLMVEITAYYKKSVFTDDAMFLICEME